MMRGWQCKPCRNLQDKVGTGQECVMSPPNEAVEPTPDHWYLCASTFYIWNKWGCFRGTHTVVPWWLCLEQWKHPTELAFGFVWMNHYCKFVPAKKKISLQSLEACRFLMVIIWDWKVMWEIGPYWYFSSGGILKAYPVLKLCLCTCYRKD